MERMRKFVLPLYLLLAIVLGGSVQGVWSNLVLQLLAIGLIAWAALTPRVDGSRGPHGLLGLLVIAGVALVVLQLFPLPPGLWSSLPGREPVVEGFRLLALDLPWLPLSLEPYVTLDTALALLAPVAVLVTALRIGIPDERLVAGAILLGAVASIFLGAAQLASGNGNAFHLYEITNKGAVGFFANRNHLGTMLLFAIPLSVALFATTPPGRKERGGIAGLAAIGGAAFLLLLLGIVLNGSLAALALAVPVIAASALLFPNSWRFRGLIAPAAAVALVAAVAVMASNPVQQDLTEGSQGASFTTRAEIWSQTAEAIADTFPAGTGFGTFAAVYAQHESPAEVDNTYVNHAHNDYLEIALEAGLLGILLLLLFLLWWGATALRVWRSTLSSHFARAATIASAAVLAHSVVDFPLRTSAIATLFALSLALMARPPRARRTSHPSEVRPTKHLVVG